MKYLNKTQGLVSLFVNHELMSKKRFRNSNERKRIMSEWLKSFEFISGLATVYIEISHYEVLRDPDLKEAKELEYNQVKLKKRVYERSKIVKYEPVKQIERPMAVYTNTRLYDL